MKTKTLKHRFSLIELLVVIAILMVLAGIGIGVHSLVSRKMRDSACKAMIAKMSIALENYKAKTGYYIQKVTAAQSFYMDRYTGSGNYGLLNEIDIPSSQLGGSSGGFWLDPWGTPFIYQCPGRKNPMSFDLYSCGVDRISTGTDNDPSKADDITNWHQ